MLRLSLTTAMIGILALFFIYYFAEIPEYRLDEVEGHDSLKTRGTVGFVQENEKVVSMQLTACLTKVDAVYFKNNAKEEFNLSKGEDIEIEGQWYEGKIIVGKIKK